MSLEQIVVIVLAAVLQRFGGSLTQWLSRFVSNLFRRADRPEEGTGAVLSYLCSSYLDPTRMLRDLGHANCILSGPMAVGFHLGNFSSSEASWDWYTFPTADCVGRALTALANAGVIWDDLWQPLRDIARASSGSVFYIHVDDVAAFLALAPEAPREYELLLVLALIAKAFQRQPERERVNVGHTLLVIIRGDRSLGSGSASTITMTGRTTHNKTNRKVRLMCAPGQSPIEVVLAFYASSMQCFVSAYGAGHLYYQKACKREAYLWYNNRQQIQTSDNTALATAAQGWKLSAPPSAPPYTVRTLESSTTSRFMTVNVEGAEAGGEQELNNLRRRAYERLTWEEGDGGTRLLYSASTALRDSPGPSDRRRCDKADRSEDAAQGEDVAVREIALAHSVFFHHAYQPSEV